MTYEPDDPFLRLYLTTTEFQKPSPTNLSTFSLSI